jgi:hypothetical protein
VSFPRSGHHWLLRMLRSNLGSYIRYGSHPIDDATLETHPNVNLQTEHDMDLETSVNTDFQHIVQYRRDKDAALLSAWNAGCCNSEQYRERFFEMRSSLYDEWKAKWVDADIPNRVVIAYEDMLENTLRELHRAYVFLTDFEPSILVVELPRLGIGHYDIQTDGI